MDCIFCKIVQREMDAKVVYEDEHVLAFRDINPRAPTHVLVVPRKHIASLADAEAQDAELLGRVLLAGAEVARREGLGAYRTVFNVGAGAGQTVFHLHLHVLGGRSFSWPPG